MISVLTLHNFAKSTVWLVMQSIEHNLSLLSPSVIVKPCSQVAAVKHQLDYEPALNVLTLTSSSAVNILITIFRV